MASRPRRRSLVSSILPHAVVVAVATASVLEAAALLGVRPAQATAYCLAHPDSRAGLAAGGASAVQDPWTHDNQVIADLKASPPAEPVVCLLGGSAARECTVSEARWATQVRKLGAIALSYNLGSSHRTLAEDTALMQALPSDQLHMIVFIGMNVGCFTSTETSASFTLPTPVFPLPPWTEHLRHQSHILSLATKRSMVSGWTTSRYPVFKANYSIGRKMLKRLISVCKSRGLHPVLVELPRNMAVIGHTMDAPIARVTRTCHVLSKKYSIPFVGGWVKAAHLANGDFYDIWHLVEPGRVKWQRLLSEKTAQLLKLYSLGSTGFGRRPLVLGAKLALGPPALAGRGRRAPPKARQARAFGSVFREAPGFVAAVCPRCYDASKPKGEAWPVAQAARA